MTVKRKLLIAEDDKYYAEIYKLKFEKEGFDTRVVNDGKSFVAEFKKKRPDLCLLDLIMPVMDGFKALETLNKAGVIKNTPIITISNLGQEEEKRKALALGAKEYLVKADQSLPGIVNKVRSYLE
jgi:DNA-binding response OmpR family regulator